MIPIETLAGFFAASVILALAPGPDNIFVLTQSALYGKMSGIFVMLGLCTGLIVHTTAVAFGVAAIFQVSEIAFTGLKIFGACYLAWLAWQAFKASSSEIAASENGKKSIGKLYRRGILMNITNPKVSIFFPCLPAPVRRSDPWVLNPSDCDSGGHFHRSDSSDLRGHRLAGGIHRQLAKPIREDSGHHEPGGGIGFYSSGFETGHYQSLEIF